MTETVQPENPLTAGLERELQPQPCTLVILGGSGDLSKRKLLPALYNLLLDGVLPASIATVGFARTDLGDDGFRQFAREGVEKHSRRALDAAHWSDFESSLSWVTGSLDVEADYQALKARLEQLERERGLPGHRIFYLAIPPRFMATTVKHLSAAGLVPRPGEDGGRFARVIVEKPIGRDLASARDVNATLASVLDEGQTFRIDHYLGKETVQNIMVMRFANSIFEPLWNQKYVDHVQITAAEEVGVGSRAGYYDKGGALRDMVQNHILQLLTLTAMEPPYGLTASVVRDHKLEVLKCLRPIRGEDVAKQIVRAQYAAGFVRGGDVPGYRREHDVPAESTTETYVAAKLYIDNWRWAGVPFYLRTGKRMAKRVTEIAVHFKPVPQVLFNAIPNAPLEPNVLALRIQPDEGLSLRISTKLPGAKVKIYPVKMDFRYGSTFGDQSPEAYERLLLDVMAGDATLFMRGDAVEASWAWITPLLDAWQSSGLRWLPEYAAGTWGPVEADRLIEADGRAWRKP